MIWKFVRIRSAIRNELPDLNHTSDINSRVSLEISKFAIEGAETTERTSESGH
jgi:hypothetical protein